MQHNEYSEGSLTPASLTSGEAEGEALYEKLLPIWSGQIEAARLLTNVSIEQLSQRFYSLSQQVQKTVSESVNHDSSSNILELLQESQTQLGLVIQIFKASINEKQVMLEAANKLTSHTQELNGMTDLVIRIAKETNLVAENAVMEFSHQGEKSPDFVLVADAIRRLSNEAAKVGENLTEKFSSVTQDITAITQIANDYEKKDKKLLTETEQIMHSVVNQISITTNQIMTNKQLLENESKHTSHEISDVLVFLQFQDRVSQMLGHVTQDIHKLHEALQSGCPMPDVEEWLGALKATYTMKEEEDIHDGKPFDNIFDVSNAKSNHSSSSGTTSSDEVTFF